MMERFNGAKRSKHCVTNRSLHILFMVRKHQLMCVGIKGIKLEYDLTIGTWRILQTLQALLNNSHGMYAEGSR